MNVPNIQNRYIIKILFLFSLLLCIYLFSISFSISAQAKTYDPSLEWKTLESEHFFVIFPKEIYFLPSQGYQQIANIVAEIAEEAYNNITPSFGEPFNKNQKIAIILEDFSDSVYGFASVVPHRCIRLNLTAPGFKNFDTKFENWLKILITHEYTHLAHFDMTRNITSFLRTFLGQVIAPNALQPMWATEGLAIYNESKWNEGGRIEDTRYDMYLRTDFLQNKTKDLKLLQGNYFTSWPGGNLPYIYGQSLVHYIVENYSEVALMSISDKFCAFPLLGINWAIKEVIGINQEELYQNWKDSKYRNYQKQIEEVYKFGNLTKSDQITNYQYWVDDPMWLVKPGENKEYLLYKVTYNELYPTIRKYDKENKDESIVINRTTGHGSSYTLSPDKNNILYSKLSQYQQYYRYYDLFLYNLENHKQIKITDGLRIKDPSWHPFDSKNVIVAVLNNSGNNNLVIFCLEDKLNNKISLNEKTTKKITQQDYISYSDITFLTNFNDGTQLSQPVWSPNGKQIAFSLWNNGYQDIYIADIDENYQIQSIKPITRDKHTDISPSWSQDGESIYFSSDRSGIFNIYSYNLKDSNFFRLTNVLTGAFEPAISPSGKQLAFIQYHSTGYELHLAETTDMLDTATGIEYGSLYQADGDWDTEYGSLFTGTSLIQVNREPYSIPVSSQAYQVTDYSPWDSILPTYWTPYISMTSNDLFFGLSSMAQDYLKFYNFPFKIGWSIFNPTISYDIQFRNYFHKQDFLFSWQGETSLTNNQIDNFFNPEYTTSRFQAKLNFPREGYTSNQDYGRYFNENLSFSFQNDLYSLDLGNDDTQDNNNLIKINSIVLRYSYNDTEGYSSSISPEIGSNFSLNYQHANKIIGSDLTFNKILFDGKKYFPLNTKNQVLALRLIAGVSTKGLNEKEQFHLGGNSSLNIISSINNTVFPLRGFASKSFKGNNLLYSSIEYRFPIKTIEKKVGFDWASMFLENVSGTLFLDAGNAWEGNFDVFNNKINASIGAELNFKFKQGQTSPINITFGSAKPITEKSSFRFYFQTGISF